MEVASDSSEDDWNEVNDEADLIKCLFCKEENLSFCDAIHHLKVTHDFDLMNFRKRHSMDIYSYIKLVNYVRRHGVSSQDLKALNAKLWDEEQYLKPELEDDAWLMLDIEDLAINDCKKANAYPVNSENGLVTLSEVHFAELQRTIQTLKAEVEQRGLACMQAKQQIDDMSKKAHNLVLGDDLQGTQETNEKNNCRDDKGYFNTYSHFGIHHEMLTDKVRTESYRDALLTNSHMFTNCVMLDVGCGTSILSMFAAKSGCRKVISVDQSEIIYHATDIVRENNLSDIITLQKGRLEDIDLKVEKVDAIISEWMGYFLLFEGMLDTVLYARDKYLKPGGKILPNRVNISLVGSGDTKRYVDLIDYWSNVYGFKMSCMKAEVVKEPSIEICNAKELITNVAEIQTFDLYTVDKDCVNFTATFKLTVKKTGSLTAIIGYFDVFFDLDNPICFSTGPESTPTHWKQTVFSLSEPISITEGDILPGKLTCRRHPSDVRGLIVTIDLNNVSQEYHLD